MASIRDNVSKGVVTSYSVLFRMPAGKDGKQTSRTFALRKAPRGSSAIGAEEFKNLVDALGPEEAVRELDERLNARPTGLTLDELAAKWFDARQLDVDTGEITKHTLTGYKRDYANWIQPWLGDRQAASIDETDVQALVDHMRRSNLAPKSVLERHAILHGIYHWASAQKRRAQTGIEHNPCKETDLPKRAKSDPKGLRMPEIYALLAAAKDLDPDAHDLIAFMVSTGWRFSEAVALTVGAVEDDGRQVYVTMEQVLRREAGIVQDGKSRAAMRRLRVLGPGVAVLRDLVVGKAPGDLVFTFADGRPGVKRRHAWNKNALRDRRWQRIIDAAGLSDTWTCGDCDASGARSTAKAHVDETRHEIHVTKGRNPTPHWLRHSHVAVCHAAGLSLAEIQRRLGHEDIQTTINIYGRLIDDMDDRAADRLDALLSGRVVPVLGGAEPTPQLN